MRVLVSISLQDQVGPYAKAARGIIVLLLLTLSTTVQTLGQQPYVLDTTFVATFDYNNPFLMRGSIKQVYEHPNGKDLLTVGSFDDAFFNPSGPKDMVRLFRNGTHDTAFLHSYIGSVDGSYHGTKLIGKAGQHYWIQRGPWTRKVDMTGAVTDCAYTDTLYTLRGSVTLIPILLLDDGRLMAGLGGPPGLYNFLAADTCKIARIDARGKFDTSFLHYANDYAIGSVEIYDSLHYLVWGKQTLHTYDGHNLNSGYFATWLFRIDTAGFMDTTFRLSPLTGG